MFATIIITAATKVNFAEGRSDTCYDTALVRGADHCVDIRDSLRPSFCFFASSPDKAGRYVPRTLRKLQQTVALVGKEMRVFATFVDCQDLSGLLKLARVVRAHCPS